MRRVHEHWSLATGLVLECTCPDPFADKPVPEPEPLPIREVLRTAVNFANRLTDQICDSVDAAAAEFERRFSLPGEKDGEQLKRSIAECEALFEED